SSAVTVRASSGAGTSFTAVPAFESGARTPSATTTSRDMRLFGGLVHRLDQAVVARLQNAPLDLQRRRDRAVFDREIRRQEREGANLLVVRLSLVVGVDLLLEERPDLGARVHGFGLPRQLLLGRVLPDAVEVGH